MSDHDSSHNQSSPSQMGTQQGDMSSETSEEKTFEQALEQLQEVVKRLNQPELPLDEAMKIYERGVRLAHHGRSLLSQAERQFESLRNNLGDGDEPSS